MTATSKFEGQTIGKLVDELVAIARTADKDAARAFLDDYRAWIVASGHPATNAEANIGYASGYCDRDTARLIRSVFLVVHPVFGADDDPSPEKAIEAGKRMAMGEFDA